MVTIRQIAQMAHVSRGTVDRVLNNRGSVSPETAQRVREIADSLGYMPNRAGMVLAAQKKKLKIGVIVFGTENPFFRDLLGGVSTKAKELSSYDCSVVIRKVAYDPEAQLRAIDELCEEGINGLIITPVSDPLIVNRINELFDDGIPVVTTNSDIDGSRRLAYVGSDYYKSGRIAGGLMRLVTGGRAKVGIITGSHQVLCHTDRIAGFRSALSESAPGIEILDTLENHDDEFESYEVTRHFLKAHPDADALFFSAAGVTGGCRAIINMNRTRNMHIICFDADSSAREMFQDGLISATISQQPEMQGSVPLDLLFEYLTTGVKPEEEIHCIDTSVLVRESIF